MDGGGQDGRRDGATRVVRRDAGAAAVCLGAGATLLVWLVAGLALRRRGRGWWGVLLGGWYVAMLTVPHLVLEVLDRVFDPLFRILSLFDS